MLPCGDRVTNSSYLSGRLTPGPFLPCEGASAYRRTSPRLTEFPIASEPCTSNTPAPVEFGIAVRAPCGDDARLAVMEQVTSQVLKSLTKRWPRICIPPQPRFHLNSLILTLPDFILLTAS